MTEALQARAGQYDNIAAVTTTADGSLTPEERRARAGLLGRQMTLR